MADTFVFKTGGSLAGNLDGGGGTSTLDYSNYLGNITVDLPLSLATAVAGAISNIQNVTGSQGNDLIVGDVNPNVLIGGTGRNILIGGAGADALDASKATSDNIVIGGTTDFDTNLPDLQAIFNEWTRTDLGFNDRFSDLTTGKNSLKKTPLNQVNGLLILLIPSTVHKDASPDTLTGSTNTDPMTKARVHNWFFIDSDDPMWASFLNGWDKQMKET
jgi:Ca2+-binding RTX toxin-like protein